MQTAQPNPRADAESINLTLGADRQHPIILFDGECGLCNTWVNFIINRDPGARLRFAALQSSVAHELLARFQLDADYLDSVVLVHEGKCDTHSTAALKIMRLMPWPWLWMSAFLWLPRPARDLFYRFIARNRYRWFGKVAQCRVPTPDLRARFLD